MATNELDVHGMMQEEAVDAFVAECNAALARAGRSVSMRVVHGYGSSGQGGVLGARLRGFCDTHADRVAYMRGEDAENNPGVTIVTVRGALPDARERLGTAIVRCADRPRTKGRIAGRFRRVGERAVADALRELLRQGRLRRREGGRGGYQAR